MFLTHVNVFIDHRMLRKTKMFLVCAIKYAAINRATQLYVIEFFIA